MSDHIVSYPFLALPPQLLQPYTVSGKPAITSQVSQPAGPQPQPQPEPQPQHMLHPKEKEPSKPKKVKQPKPSPFEIQTFTSGMLPLSDISRYPIYCRKDDKEKPSNPIIRARKIFDVGKQVPKGQNCSRCLEHGHICIRARGFSKCSYCTAEDLHPKEMCHESGVPDPAEEILSMTALSKKRKMDARTEAVSATTVFESAYGQSHFQVSTPAKRVRGLTGYSVSKPENSKPVETKIQDISTAPQSALESVALTTDSISTEARFDSTLMRATLDRVAALEKRVSSLEKLQVKPDTESEITTTLPPNTTSPS